MLIYLRVRQENGNPLNNSHLDVIGTFLLPSVSWSFGLRESWVRMAVRLEKKAENAAHRDRKNPQAEPGIMGVHVAPALSEGLG